MLFSEEDLIFHVKHHNHDKVKEILTTTEFRYFEEYKFKSILIKSCLICIIHLVDVPDSNQTYCFCFSYKENKFSELKELYLKIFFLLYEFKNCMNVSLELKDFDSEYYDHKQQNIEITKKHTFGLIGNTQKQNILLLFILFEYKVLLYKSYFSRNIDGVTSFTSIKYLENFHHFLPEFDEPRKITDCYIHIFINYFLEKNEIVTEVEFNTIFLYEKYSDEIYEFNTFFLYFENSVNYKINNYDVLSNFLSRRGINSKPSNKLLKIIENWLIQSQNKLEL